MQRDSVHQCRQMCASIVLCSLTKAKPQYFGCVAAKRPVNRLLSPGANVFSTATSVLAVAMWAASIVRYICRYNGSVEQPSEADGHSARFQKPKRTISETLEASPIRCRAAKSSRIDQGRRFDRPPSTSRMHPQKGREPHSRRRNRRS